MEHLEPYLNVFLANPEYIGAIAFILILLGGEPVVLALSFIAATYNILSLPTIMLMGFSTALLAEIFWFLFARSPWINLFGTRYGESRILQDFHYYFGKLERNKPFRLLFFTRFISGLTIMVIIYLSRRKIPFLTFLRYCLLVNLFWTPVVVFIGWGGGKGFTFLFEIVNNIHYALFIIFLLAVILYLINHSFRKYLLKKL